MRGEHAIRSLSLYRSSGSSPRARGTPSSGLSCITCNRFIPACAGNTQTIPRPLPPTAVHPRVRGEHHWSMIARDTGTGSSPRARGTHIPAILLQTVMRFIPACAGNTSGTNRRRTTTAVHPRVRGEHCDGTPGVALVWGSSPRARGTPIRDRRRLHERRFIPACAGNTPRRRRSMSAGAVHPRVRGEHELVAIAIADTDGSSPRARGTRRVRRL